MYSHRRLFRATTLLLSLRALAPLALLPLAACGGGDGQGGSYAGSGYAETALVANRTGLVATVTTIDANLSNPWGLAMPQGGPIWIADNNSNVATLYDGKGNNLTARFTGSATIGISIPPSSAGVAANSTGQVFNGGRGFQIETPTGRVPAVFLFDGEGGTITAWAKGSGATAVTVYDDGIANGVDHAVYKGLALGTVAGADVLYAADLHNNKVDVFDTNFLKPTNLQGKFVDPSLPPGFAPFGIATINNQVYVTYAMQDSSKHDEKTGTGLGYVDIYTVDGTFVSRFATAGDLDAPWGIALAPAGYGSFAGDVLIGNFGDGQINIFTPNGTALATPLGPLTTANGGALRIPGLWSLAFGNGDADKPLTTLFYTAGFANQTDGVFGTISTSSASTTYP